MRNTSVRFTKRPHYFQVNIRHFSSGLNYYFVDEIDLSDQAGVRKNLLLNPTDYAIKYLEEKDTLILVKIESK